MREYSLRLFEDERSERVDLPLHEAGEEQPLSYLLEAPGARVYANGGYYMQLVSVRTRDVRLLDVQLNHYPIEFSFYSVSGHIYFESHNRPKDIFCDTFGLARFTLRLSDRDGTHILHSDYAQVIVPYGDENFSVNAMGAYIASHSKLLFYGTRSDYISRYTRHDLDRPSLEDKIRVLKRTAAILESAWRLIRQNPRKSDAKGRASRYSSAEAIRYLMKHPECLRPSPIGQGIRIGSRSYIPDLSQCSLNEASTDVYENQVTLSFLNAVIDDICAMIPALEDVVAQLPTRSGSGEGLVSSAAFMLSATKNSLEGTLEDLRDLQAIYSHLLDVFALSIPAQKIELKSEPKATPAFLRLPGYHQVYESIHRWFMLSDVSVRDVRFVRTFLQITETYEVYVLMKLAQFFEDWGFELTSARQISYEFERYSLYKNTEINNVFVYEKDDLKITLFYQPVLYDQSSAQTQITGLVRSTSLSIPVKGSAEPSHGRYYTPDYVLRIESSQWKGARYILADAKYTTMQNVRAYKMFPLIFKYLFSLTPLDSNDQITGLYVFNGKSGNPNDRLTLVRSIYDLLDKPHDVLPQVEMISLYEYAGQRQSDQFEVLRHLLSIQIEKARASCILPGTEKMKPASLAGAKMEEMQFPILLASALEQTHLLSNEN